MVMSVCECCGVTRCQKGRALCNRCRRREERRVTKPPPGVGRPLYSRGVPGHEGRMAEISRRADLGLPLFGGERADGEEE